MYRTSKHKQSLVSAFRKTWRGAFSMTMHFVMGWQWRCVTTVTVRVRVTSTQCGEGTGGWQLVTTTANASVESRVRVILPPSVFSFASPTVTTFALLLGATMVMTAIFLLMVPFWMVFSIMWAAFHFACFRLVSAHSVSKVNTLNVPHWAHRCTQY